jgi:hypothetical protein
MSQSPFPPKPPAESAAEFFAARAKRGSLKRFDELLRRVPARPPMPGDEIE